MSRSYIKISLLQFPRGLRVIWDFPSANPLFTKFHLSAVTGSFCSRLGKVPSKHETYVHRPPRLCTCSPLLAQGQALYHEHAPQERGDVRYALLELRLW